MTVSGIVEDNRSRLTACPNDTQRDHYNEWTDCSHRRDARILGELGQDLRRLRQEEVHEEVYQEGREGFEEGGQEIVGREIADQPARPSSRLDSLVGLLATAACLAHSGLRAPIPGVNEPHYLTKARHLLDPAWCSGDFFLESSNPHLVFYLLTGPLTQFLPLAAVALIGRFLGLVLLATGWIALVKHLTPDRSSRLVATASFLLIAALGNLSGEWVVGGIESKVLAYGLLAWSAAHGLRRHPRRAAVLCGLAISLHPIVGGWGLLLAMMAGPRTVTRARLQQAALVGICALPGLIPAMALLGNGSARADSLQVFARLGHHLVPNRFSTVAIAAYAAILLAWLWTGFSKQRRLARSETESWWSRLVLASVGVAIVGAALALDRPPGDLTIDQLRVALMKFYPYRMVDVLVPAAMSVTIATQLARCCRCGHRLLVAGSLLALALALPAHDRNPSRMAPERLADWTHTCRWIEQNLPHDAVVLTPPDSWAFKWYAGRAEYVVFKDCPQDAAGILEWDRRRQVRGRWLHDIQLGRNERKTTASSFPPGRITHILWRRTDRFDSIDGFQPLYKTRHYTVYAIAPPDSQ